MLKTIRIIAMALSVLLTETATAQSDQVTVEVTFATVPSRAATSFAELKYNKQGVFNYEMDDRSPDIRNVFAFFHGGKAPVNGFLYPGKTFSDGCGNRVKWTAALASNARLQSNNLDFANYNNCPAWSEMAMLVKNNWLIENHGFYHNKSGTYSYGEDTYKNINDNTRYIRDSLLAYGVNFTPRVLVIPNSDAGYCGPAEALGYLASVTQNTSDPYQVYPQWIDNSLTVASLPDGYMVLNRGLMDSYSAGNVSWYKTVIADRFISGMSAFKKKVWRFAGHYFLDAESFGSFMYLMDYLDQLSEDRVWVTTAQEMLEYFETKRKVVKRESLSGNKLTIRLDLSTLTAANYFKDMSLLVDADAPIASVTVTGADSRSYNASTGLINVFKRSKVFPVMVVLPLTLEQFTARRNGNAAEVRWAASFDQAAEFTLERSTDGRNFTGIRKVQTSGRSNGVQAFSHRDAQPAPGVNFYRLKYEEPGQSPRYSSVISINFSTDGTMQIFPNPVKDGKVELRFEKPVQGMMQLLLRNEAGMLVQRKMLSGGLQSRFQVRFDQVKSSGTYILQVENGDKREARVVVFQ